MTSSKSSLGPELSDLRLWWWGSTLLIYSGDYNSLHGIPLLFLVWGEGGSNFGEWWISYPFPGESREVTLKISFVSGPDCSSGDTSGDSPREHICGRTHTDPCPLYVSLTSDRRSCQCQRVWRETLLPWTVNLPYDVPFVDTNFPHLPQTCDPSGPSSKLSWVESVLSGQFTSCSPVLYLDVKTLG